MKENPEEFYLIVGDSWGRGEWVNQKITHPGLEHYLKEAGINVVNRSVPGTGNFEALEQIKNFLTYECSLENLKNLKGIFLFWTEWHRDFRIKPFGVFDLAKDIDWFAKWFAPNKFNKKFYGMYQHRVLLEFNRLATNINVPIDVIGGAADLEYFDEFDNIHCTCQSFVNLCINNVETTDNPVPVLVYPESFVKIMKNEKTTDVGFLVDELSRSADKGNLLTEYQTEYFSDKLHANRTAHKKLFNFLKEKL